jgi:mono/diheme cytochrome c family protein
MTGGRYFAVAGVLALFTTAAAYASQATPAAAPAAEVSPNAASISTGQALFKRHCQGCHGETGAGDGLAAKFLNGKLPDLTDKTTMALRTDADLHELIAKGKKGEIGTMPAFNARLTDPEIGDLINFVRTLGH